MSLYEAPSYHNTECAACMNVCLFISFQCRVSVLLALSDVLLWVYVLRFVTLINCLIPTYSNINGIVVIVCCMYVCMCMLLLLSLWKCQDAAVAIIVAANAATVVLLCLHLQDAVDEEKETVFAFNTFRKRFSCLLLNVCRKEGKWF